jgi:hypothetical protein
MQEVHVTFSKTSSETQTWLHVSQVLIYSEVERWSETVFMGILFNDTASITYFRII